MGIEACRTFCCVLVICVAILLGLTQGFYWAFLGLNPNSQGGLIALYCISAIVLLIICVVGILGACNCCYPVFLIMWIIGMVLLTVVLVVQIGLQATQNCSAAAGTVQSIVCNGTGAYATVTWAGLGVTLGLAVCGLVFGIILFKIIYDEENGTSGSSSSGSKGGKNDFVY